MEECKIKVGEYVRTPEEGYIGKLVEINPNVLNYYKIDVKKEIRRTNGMSDNYIYSRDGFGLKHSFNIIDLIEDEDIAVLEYKSPKYKKRVIRRFEVFKIDDDIRFENAYCNFHCKVGDKRITDTICKNIKVKSIVTKEQFKNIEYKVED